MNGKAIILPDRAPALAHYPHARKIGDRIYVSGISSRKLDGTWEGVETLSDGSFKLDIKAQTRAVIENIKIILEAAGSSLSNLIDVTVFLVDMKDYQAMNQVYNEYFDAETGPSRTTVAVKELPNPRLLIEIKSIAAV
jgi:2-aminomuconate deaminase